MSTGRSQKATHYLSTAEVADYLGLASRGSLPNNLPEPDAYVGRARGWLVETIDKWNAARPGKGGRPRKQRPAA
ncbi:XRE family transcriptional regulator [Brevibacterium sp. 50QC2O2]|jgi:hypothetical protein|uniref:XRE family transcriptional regulator n=1 Tax=Brevibacterium TaxID=1696 RepID=UPI00211C34A1|nr:MULTISPECIES: XRE family transcriptional regulator [unclassified Brevibacterium]MCQ9368944.1 XRE family transcriptional regulator [Brevibacterium sp. 91QC2O2]MCQ9385981.1 XRE family transcriptional regulator [Brevibacterium sp. 68QC2CO]MCQ9387728.1 XRE family transcriptional regulator [Brevibacterium sp. 50QC2O2]